MGCSSRDEGPSDSGTPWNVPPEFTIYAAPSANRFSLAVVMLYLRKRITLPDRGHATGFLYSITSIDLMLPTIFKFCLRLIMISGVGNHHLLPSRRRAGGAINSASLSLTIIACRVATSGITVGDCLSSWMYVWGLKGGCDASLTRLMLCFSMLKTNSG